MPTLTINLPDDDRYVVFTEAGGGQPNRLIFQFADMRQMQDALESFVKAKNKTYVDRRVALDQYG